MDKTEGLDKMKRAQRVRRIRAGIIIGVFAFCLFSFVLSVIALVSVGRIHKELADIRLLIASAEQSGEMTGNRVEALMSQGEVGSGNVAEQPENVEAAETQETVNAEETLPEDLTVQELPEISGVSENPVSEENALPDNAVQTLVREDDRVKVCLTFDDGPSEYTNQILDILAEYGVKATFFVNGHEGYDAQYRRIVEEGHSIGMHSFSHVYADVYRDLDSFAEDLYEIQSYIEEKTGVVSMLYRFPGGSSNTAGHADMHPYIQYLNAKGITYFDWNVSSGDAVSGYVSADTLVDNVMRQIGALGQDTIVVLMHDAPGRATTVEALPEIIRRIQERGDMDIVPITENVTPVQHIRADS